MFFLLIIGGQTAKWCPLKNRSVRIFVHVHLMVKLVIITLKVLRESFCLNSRVNRGNLRRSLMRGFCIIILYNLLSLSSSHIQRVRNYMETDHYTGLHFTNVWFQSFRVISLTFSFQYLIVNSPLKLLHISL